MNRCAVFVWCASAFVALACSSTTPPATADAAADAGADSGPTQGQPLSSKCPPLLPNAGSPCTLLGAQCEYGNDAALPCNNLARCLSAGWTLTPVTGVCPSTPNQPSCPADWASASNTVPTATVCKRLGLTCWYPEGSCECDSTQSMSIVWAFNCSPSPPSGCPAMRPYLGVACSTEALACAYNGSVERCINGMWNAA